jgi:PAS domain S-box-containing protein
VESPGAVSPQEKFRPPDVLLQPVQPVVSSKNPGDLDRLARIYETILSTTDDFAYIFDPQGRFLYANAPLLQIWAKTLDQVVGKTCYELDYPTWHADMHMREIAQVVRDKTPIRGEVPFTGASGISGVYDYIFKPVFDAAGNVEVIVGTTRDVTDRKRDEERLKAAQLELRRHAEELEVKVAERTASLKETIGVLESFSYSIVHDMRAPLRSMQSYASILATEHAGELGPDAAHYLDRIRKSAARMDRLIQDVLSFSRVAREEIKLQPVNTDALLRDILETYPNLHAHRAHIEVKGQLPMVLGNEAALTQCFSNLLGNAFKFMREGKEPHVRIWSEPHEDKLRLLFEDNGIGIPGHLQERIFDLFERVSRTRDGSGIGLSIVKQSIERMGGKVGVRSTPDQGSLFWLELRPA